MSSGVIYKTIVIQHFCSFCSLLSSLLFCFFKFIFYINAAPVGVPESILSSQEIEEIASNHVIQDRVWEAITILPEQTGNGSAWSKPTIEKEAREFVLTNKQMLLKHFFTKWSHHSGSSRQMLFKSLGLMETQDSLYSEMVLIIKKYTM